MQGQGSKSEKDWRIIADVNKSIADIIQIKETIKSEKQLVTKIKEAKKQHKITFKIFLKFYAKRKIK